MKPLLILAIGLALILCGCGVTVADLNGAWNIANAGAVELEKEIGAGHQADLDNQNTDAGIDTVEAKWSKVYTAYRFYRAILVSTKTLLEAAEVGKDPDLLKIGNLITSAIVAKGVVQEALP